MNDFVQNMALAVYLEAAKRIQNELDSRGFTTENPESIQGLTEKIAEIILQTVQGNTNYATETPVFECGCCRLPPLPDPELEDLLRQLSTQMPEPPATKYKGNDGWEGDLQNQM